MPIFIGDVHGKYDPYKRLMEQYPNSIQVGDMGVGFRRYGGWNSGAFFTNPPHYKMVETNARFIRGNHDNPGECKKHSQWIADGSVEDDMMFVGGAYSIDKDYRHEDFDWWPDEELSQIEMLKILDIYVKNKPRMMVTHDCPEFVHAYILSHHFKIPTRTSQFFDRLFEEHKPQVWVFGHHHKSFDMNLGGTRFVCLNELEVKEIA